ncbi:MAG: ferredoxin [Pelotomaculum sp.]|nr:ferredoxin [Pelotomaculum sp.]
MVNIQVRLRLNRYNLDGEPHIRADAEKCRACLHRACLAACPARCYLPHPENGVAFHYEHCLECGTCFLICDHGALKWHYPSGGCGVSYRFA